MLSWPPLLRADAAAAMLNFEIADYPVYHSLELQWFDDAAHGTGMLALLARRESRVVDYYAQRGLRLDPAGYRIGAGTGAWAETDITDALLEISDDGVRAGLKVGRLPGEGLHRRRLIKYAAPVVSIEVLPDPRSDRSADGQPPGPARDGVAEAAAGGGTVRLAFRPPLPDLTALPGGARRDGSWSVSAGVARLTGGRWFTERDGDQVRAGLDVTEHWRPRRLPLLMRAVTTVVPVFRRWPVTYRWRAVLGPSGEITGGWTRAGSAHDDDYRRATGT